MHTPLEDIEVEQAHTGSMILVTQMAASKPEFSVRIKIDGAITPVPTPFDRVRLVNLDGKTQTQGIEALFRWRQSPFVTTSYLFLMPPKTYANTRGGVH